MLTFVTGWQGKKYGKDSAMEQKYCKSFLVLLLFMWGDLKQLKVLGCSLGLLQAFWFQGQMVWNPVPCGKWTWVAYQSTTLWTREINRTIKGPRRIWVAVFYQKWTIISCSTQDPNWWPMVEILEVLYKILVILIYQVFTTRHVHF